MRIQDVMTRDVSTISPEASVVEAAGLMRRLDVGCVPVVEDGRLIGVLTDRDIVTRCVAESSDLSDSSARDAMSTEVVTCDEETSVEEAAQMMEAHRIRRLFVVDADEQCIGVVSLGDLAVSGQDDTLSGEVLHEVSQPVRSHWQ